MMENGKLYLIPTPLGESSRRDILPAGNKAIIDTIDIFIVEEIRTARRFLKKEGINRSLDSLLFYELNEHTLVEDTRHYLDETRTGKNIGLLSEAGLPCVADPGNIIVKQAHMLGIQVVPLVGPSSLMLALMASGFTGQQFVFHGYLPVKPNERGNTLRSIEKDLHTHHRTQVFIETPYRNMAMLESIRKACHPDTLLSISADLTLETEFISTRPIRMWKNNLPDLHKHPSVFLLGE
jgi:16S rRNA (cytidine1402-2'-O)-methyltransferase